MGRRPEHQAAVYRFNRRHARVRETGGGVESRIRVRGSRTSLRVFQQLDKRIAIALLDFTNPIECIEIHAALDVLAPD